jgi:hypothetical protein
MSTYLKLKLMLDKVRFDKMQEGLVSEVVVDEAALQLEKVICADSNSATIEAWMKPNEAQN